MDFVIDVQGFKDANHEFLPKEVSIISLQDNVAGHWIIAPPCPYEELPEDVKSSNDYISRRMLGIQWFDGEVSLRKLRHHLYNVARKASRIYVRGDRKARYIESIMARKIINLEDYSPSTSFAELQKQFKCDQVCCFHACRGDEYKNQFCTVRRSHVLKQWLYSLLPIKEALTRNPDTEAFYEAVAKLLFSKRSRSVVTFDVSRDEVDNTSVSEAESQEYETAEEKSQDEY